MQSEINPVTEGQILYNSTYKEVLRISKFIETENRIAVIRSWKREEGIIV